MMGDKTKAAIVFVFLVVILTIIGAAIAKADRPTNGWFPTGAVAFIGLNKDFEAIGNDSGNIYCTRGDRHIGELGARIPVYRWDATHTITTKIEHNSCFEEEHDKNSDNRIGIFYEYKAW